MAYEWAKPGVRVICIANSVRTVYDMGLPGFLKGQTFTISDIILDDEHGLFLAFKERNRKNLGHINGFRPIITKSAEDDMEAHFSKLLSIDIDVTLDILDKHVMEEE